MTRLIGEGRASGPTGLPATDRWKWIASGLTLALVVSNAYWLNTVLNAAEDTRAASQQVGERGAMIRQLQELVPRTMPVGSKELVIAEASRLSGEEPYEKGGVLWTGHLGWVFEPDGRVKWILPGWCCDKDLMDAKDVQLGDAL